MDSAIPNAAAEGVPQNPPQPQPIFNCPSCSIYLPSGTVACPDCHTIVYSEHLRNIAIAATALENESKWLDARETWRQALVWLPADTKQYAAVQQRIGLIDARLTAAEETKAKWSRRLGPFAPVLLFLAKAKTALLFLFKFKFILSFAGFFLIYWALWGWKFGLGFTLSILIHEMGHYVAAKRRGLKVDLPVFLPGLGAYVRWYSMGVSLETLSGIALAGPFFGLLTAGACGGIALLLGEPRDTGGLFSALAHVAAWLNLLNLIPVFGLDGAQATYALDRTQRWLVLATSLIFFGLLREYVFLFIAIGMGWRLWAGGYAERPSTKTMVQYVLLLFALGIVMYLFPDTTLASRRY
jgi:Zn-dependent protease